MNSVYYSSNQKFDVIQNSFLSFSDSILINISFGEEVKTLDYPSKFRVEAQVLLARQQ